MDTPSAAIALDDMEPSRWPDAAAAIVTGLQPATGVHEQFPGYFALEIIDLTQYAERSVPMDAVLGRDLVDSTVNGARMIASGVSDRRPKLQVLIAHMGGELTSVLGRLEFNWNLNYNGIATRRPASLARASGRHLTASRQTFLVDTMGFNASGMRARTKMCGVDRVVFGADYGPIPERNRGAREDRRRRVSRLG